jgi:hypothetical protein
MYSEALRNLEKISDSIHQQRIEKQHEIHKSEIKPNRAVTN